MVIYQELQDDPRAVVIERESMERWELPHAQGPLDDAEKDRIIENMRRAFAARHYRLDLL
jgi:hypothetical protein